MLEMIDERKRSDIASTDDLLSSLVNANEKDDTGLTDSDLMGILFAYSPFRQMPTSISKEISSSSF